MLWPLLNRPGPQRWDLKEKLAGVDVVVKVNADFGHDGPAIDAYPLADPEKVDTFVRCSDLARVLGQPIPYWPLTLRDRTLLARWQPGTEPVTTLALSDVDAAVLLRMAALYEADEAASQTLVHLVRVAQHRNTESAKRFLEILSRCAAPDAVTVAAYPVDVPEAEREDLDSTVRRAGWIDILRRTDAFADLCVVEMMNWDGGEDSPFGNSEQIRLDRPHGAEWARRLEPIGRTAAHRLLGDPSEFVETLEDPLTGAPAVRKRDRDGDYIETASLQRLPTTSPFAELILDYPIWIRTADGVLFPAPQGSYYGIRWGYSGSGPGSLALMIHELLDDITAHGPEGVSGASEGLERLTQLKFAQGTVLRRDQLEAARRGEWLPTLPPSDE
ncbi:hypothetical protein [Jidongwangia harbinensis]|uniref:hypothetical protein n=1 Tax=Jidongwangia harbinensis TaxID=2878561 RepID=UPI001CDA108A|nr:hypothetical protein [Jidongwangia harbinensis]MCA2216905.1 hypothetical protein [Jidongwangia harbinensis]